MVYSWGTKPTYESEISVDEDHVFQKGDYGVLRGCAFETNRLASTALSENMFAEAVKQKFQQKGATVVYIKTDIEYSGMWPWDAVTYKVTECYFTGSPFTGAEWLLLITGLTVAAVVLTLVFTGSWAALEFVKVTGGWGGILVFIIAVAAVLLIFGVGFKGKGVVVGKK